MNTLVTKFRTEALASAYRTVGMNEGFVQFAKEMMAYVDEPNTPAQEVMAVLDASEVEVESETAALTKKMNEAMQKDAPEAADIDDEDTEPEGSNIDAFMKRMKDSVQRNKIMSTNLKLMKTAHGRQMSALRGKSKAIHFMQKIIKSNKVEGPSFESALARSNWREPFKKYVQAWIDAFEAETPMMQARIKKLEALP